MARRGPVPPPLGRIKLATPVWLSPVGLLLHFCVGIVCTLVFVALGATPALNFVAVTALAIAHEVGDGDFKCSAPGWPWNGLLDVVAFLPTPLIGLL